MSNFDKNPCHFNIFDVFHIAKSETNLKAIRIAVQHARDQLKFGKIVGRDGTELHLSEADINAMEKELLDPLRRLKAEQFVHAEHRFADDPELAECLQALTEVEELDPLPAILQQVQAAVLLPLVQGLLPPLTFQPLTDDLPWPAEPEALPLQREPLETTILRDQ